MKHRNLTRIFSILTALSIATVFGFQANSQTTTSFTFAESIEGRAPAPDNTTPEEYDGPQTVKGLMNAFDAAYNQRFSKVKVTATFGDGGVYRSELAISGEIDARHSRVEWLHMLLQRGITIEDFDDYRIYLSKRHTLAFLEDNPDLRKIGFLGMPLTDDQEAYKLAYINKLVKKKNQKEIREASKRVERIKEQIERSEKQLERAKKQSNPQRLKHVQVQLERAEKQLEDVRVQLKRIQEVLEHLKKPTPPQDLTPPEKPK
ncbi:MAG: hypothetical protein OXH00_13715 [Candidatus Poribacteria bacterium]|nr:hypothetical protein [Candidatus Poribacteria bacterium]